MKAHEPDSQRKILLHNEFAVYRYTGYTKNNARLTRFLPNGALFRGLRILLQIACKISSIQDTPVLRGTKLRFIAILCRKLPF